MEEQQQNLEAPLITSNPDVFNDNNIKGYGFNTGNECEETSVRVSVISRVIVYEVKRQLWLAWPIMVTSLLNYVLQVISIMFVGHLDQLTLAGTAMAFSFASFTGYSVMLGMASALDTLCGQSFGAKQYHMLGIHLQRSLLIVTLVCIPISILWTFTAQILMALGQDPEISIEAGKFIFWLIPTLYAFGFRICLSRFLQTQSIVMPMMTTSGITALVHILTSWMLVNVMGLGNKGAAFATDISQWTNVILLVAYVKFFPACKRTWTGFSRYALSDVYNFIKLAIPSTVMVCLVFWSFESLVLLSGFLPNPGLETSVMSICLNVSQFLFMIPYGLGIAVSTRVANELGAGQPRAAQMAVWVGIAIAVVEGLLFALPLILLRRTLGYAFSNEMKVVNYIALIMPIIGLANLLDSIQYTLSAIARGCGLQAKCAALNLAAHYFVGIPCSLLFAFVLHFRGMGLWFGLILGLFTQMLLILTVIMCTNWEKEAIKAKQRVQSAAAAIDSS